MEKPKATTVKNSNSRSSKETKELANQNFLGNKDESENLGVISFQIDVIAVTLFLVAAATRFFHLTFPRNIVFDELHYGKYAGLYLRKIFFFDPHPPLGKQLIAGATSLLDPTYNGTFKFDRIGTPYPIWVPVFALRLIPAAAGSLLPSATYLLARELKISIMFSTMAGVIVIFDNALLIQSRHILMEMPLILLGILGIVFAIKAAKRPYHSKHLFLVSAAAFFSTLSMSVKYMGSFYVAICALILFWSFWSQWIPKKELSAAQIFSKFGAIFGVFYLTFLTTYIGIFYIHLSVLTNAGPHDSVMTSAFQASLKGGLASIIKGQPLQVAHGSQVTLRHSLGRACWLHSHQQKYPIKYDDGRGSSHQQQVTCYSFKDVNNWWIIKRPDVDNLAVNETKDVIKHGDEIHLIHGMSGRLLNSHDVAAPVTPQNQEVSCYMDHNVSMPAEPLWRVELLDGCRSGEGGCEWHAVKSMIRLIHVTSGQALRMSGKQLPKWGYHQHEVVTDRTVIQDDTVWNVEEHRYTKSEKEREKELMEAEMIPTKPTTLTFWSKFWELQWKMLISGGSVNQESHAYASFPSEWPLMLRGIAYWVGAGTNAQIHLLGNPLIWFPATGFLFVHAMILVLYLLRRRRNFRDLPEEEWWTFVGQCGICLGGYVFTYAYHFCVDRTLFLHHYLPSYLFKIMLMVITLQHIYSIFSGFMGRHLMQGLLLCWLIGIIYLFAKFAPLSYGFPALSKSQLDEMKWINSWDFIIQSNS